MSGVGRQRRRRRYVGGGRVGGSVGGAGVQIVKAATIGMVLVRPTDR